MVASFVFAGHANNLKVLLEKGGLIGRLESLMEEIGYGGEFTITPQRTIPANSHTKGVLKFSKPVGAGVVGSYHPETESNDGHVQFLLSKPTGEDTSVFLDKLQGCLRKAVEKTFSKLTQPKDQTVMATQVNGAEHQDYVSVFDDQETLSLVIGALRTRSQELGVEYLTLKTARTTVVGIMSCDYVSAEKVLAELCDGEILIKKGHGPATTYAVVSQNKGGDTNVDAVGFITNITKILDEVKAAQASIPTKEHELKEKLEALNRCKKRIPVLEGEIQDLKAALDVARNFLSHPETKQAVDVARMLGKLGTNN